MTFEEYFIILNQLIKVENIQSTSFSEKLILLLKSFIDKYVIGSRCLKTKCKDIQYCNLHSEHLIHGDYLEIPSKELCYHFIKDGKYL